MNVVRRKKAKFVLNGVDITSRIDNVVVCASPTQHGKYFVTVTYNGSGVLPVMEILEPDSTLVVHELDGVTHTFNFDARPTLNLPSVISKHVTSCVFECPMQPPAVWRPYDSASFT